MVEEQLLLYHTGYSEIRVPDVHYGRKNADFGQGFYTTKNGEFAGRWAKERKDFKTVLNTYLLETKGLKIYEFKRDAAWFDYIFNNRIGKEDPLSDMDLIIGPIAIVIADSLLGEITPKMAVAVGQSPAKRILIPVGLCNNTVAGVPDFSVKALLGSVVEQVKNFLAS